jgi:hypothetical protein
VAPHRAVQPRQAQRAVWDRVAQAAERGATYPALAPGQTPGGGRKRGGRTTTAWSASASSVSAGSGGGNLNAAATTANNNNDAPALSLGSGKPPPAPPPPVPALSNAAFPTLPSSATPRARPVRSARSSQLQHILGSAPPATSAWAPGRPAQDEAGGGTGEAEEMVSPPPPAEGGAAGGKKRGKGKQKQTLFMFGSYPTAGTS